MKTRSIIRLALVLASLGLFACSSSSGDDGKGGSPGGQTGGTESTQTCTKHWGCVGGSCACADGPNKDKTCCDPATDGCSGPTNCDDFCKVCTSS